MKEKQEMKKLMIAAAAVAMIGSAFADAQVYDAKLSVKTTTCKKGKVTTATAAYINLADFLAGGRGDYAKGDSVLYRKQATRTIKGAFWGCDCDTIAEPMWRVYNPTRADKKGKLLPNLMFVGGYAFWEEKVADAFDIPFVSFKWVLLNRIDQFTKVEGTWQLCNWADGQAFYFLGAGFGSCKNAAGDCDSYISSISGSFAGFMQIGADGEGDVVKCFACGDEFKAGFGCFAAPFCLCDNVVNYNNELTAAYGTWSIKYNSSASKKLQKDCMYYVADGADVKGAVKFAKKYAGIEAELVAARRAALAEAGVIAKLGKEEADCLDSDKPTVSDIKEIKDPATLKDQFYKNLDAEDPGALQLKDGLAKSLIDLS